MVGVRLLGRQPEQWRPQWYYFLVLNVCRDVGMTYSDRRSSHNIAGGLGGAISPQRVQGRALVGVQGAKPLEAPKNLHLTVPYTGSKIMCIAVQSHRKVPIIKHLFIQW